MSELIKCTQACRSILDGKVGAWISDIGVNGIRARGFGRSGQPGIRPSRCKTAKISNGPIMMKEAPLRLEVNGQQEINIESHCDLSESVHIFDHIHYPSDLMSMLPRGHFPHHAAREAIVKRSDEAMSA